MDAPSLVDAPPATASTKTKAKKKRNTSRIIEQTWIWSVVGYSVLRFVVAWGAFGEHGANIWIFALVDIGTAYPYAKSVAVVCKRAANAEWSRLPLAAAVAIATFFAPYAYLWFAAGEMPANLRIGMTICVSVLLLAATAGIVAKTRKLRRESVADNATVAGDANGYAGPETQIVIDLTGDGATIERRVV